MSDSHVEEVGMKRVEPFFFLKNKVDQKEKYLDTYEICKASNVVLGNAKLINGVKRIDGLWKLYFNNETARGHRYLLQE